MKTRQPAPGRAGFTLVEMLLVIAIIGVLAALLLPSLSRARLQSQRAVCINNLRQIGLGFHSFAHDHNSLFPMQVTAWDGGSREFASTNNGTGSDLQLTYHHFQPLSRTLVTPAVLVCPSDTRLPARDFNRLRNENLSYFVALNARYGVTSMILSGDRNLTNTVNGGQSLYRVGTNQAVWWSGEMHQWKGNLLFADGHVEKANGLRLVSTARMPFAPTDLLVPSRASTPPGTPTSGAGSARAVEESAPSALEPAKSNAPEDNVPAVTQSDSGIGMVPLAPVQSGATRVEPVSDTHTVVTNEPIEVPIVSESDLEPEPSLTPPTARLHFNTHWLWWLLVLLVAVAGYRFWRAWRRYLEEP